MLNTTTMTIEEIKEGVKLWTGTKTTEMVQAHLLRLGFTWAPVGPGHLLEGTFSFITFLAVEGSQMREIVNMDCYLKCTFPEVTYKDILDVPIPSFNFKPFDRVLVRGSSKDKWEANIFAEYTGVVEYPYKCIDKEPYPECIPYAGNEKLLGTWTPKL